MLEKRHQVGMEKESDPTCEESLPIMRHLRVKLLLLFLMGLVCLVSVNDPGSGEVYGQPRAFSRSRVEALEPHARGKFNKAMREMRARGLKPQVNSTFRSRAEQQAIYRCASNRACRLRRGIYGAKQPGTSLHEAGLAVDIGGVATGHRQQRRLTPKGKQIVRIMEKHGFDWRYGLKDPAHFETNPRAAGYRSERAAIEAGQRRGLSQNQRVRRTSGNRRT